MNAESPLLRVLELSRAMLEAARAADWDRLAGLEAEREPLAMQQHPPGEVSLMLLGEILACDRQLRDLLTAARDETADQWEQARGKARAIAAYGR